MTKPTDLTKNQKATLKKLLLKQDQWNKEKDLLQRAKVKQAKGSRKA